MKKAHLKDLQSQLLGSVTDSDEVRRQFATDAGIFAQEPEAVVFPANTADVRKTVKLLAERLESGKPAGVTARGAGGGLAGAAVGSGTQIVFPAQMDHLIKLEKDTVTVQPGMNLRSLEQVLQSHGRFLPPFPASAASCTVGGAVATNAASEYSSKYGSTRDFVRSLKVVLADGSLIETRRLSARELHRRKGQTNLEGEIYRKIDGLILDNEDVVSNLPRVSRNASGYALDQVRRRDGSFDLGQIIVGSEGTLGVVTEITLKTLAWNQRTTLVAGFFDDMSKALDAAAKLKVIKPAALELADRNLIKIVHRTRPQEIVGLLPDDQPCVVLLVEFNDKSQLKQSIRARRTQAVFKRYAASFRVAGDPIEREALWKLRRAATAAPWLAGTSRQFLPAFGDPVVPAVKVGKLISGVYKLLDRHDIEAGICGAVGDGHIQILPLLDLSKKKDVTAMHDVLEGLADLVRDLGGTMSGQLGDGLLVGPYLERVYGGAAAGLFGQVKAVFDPAGLLNSYVKTGSTASHTAKVLRSENPAGHHGALAENMVMYRG